jgi:8-amino-7-oxononanoate synthase
MDGDLADLARLQQLADNQQAWLFIDDAHGLGVFGREGRGAFDHFNLKIEADTILVGTFGKAFGTSGAFVAGSTVLIESLIQFARPFIYTTAMSPMNALATRTALKLLREGEDLREKLHANIKQFREGALALGLDLMPSVSAIQPILLGDSARAVAWSEALKAQGFWVAAIRPPTVPQNQARLRITLSAAHQSSHIQALLSALARLAQRKM